MIMIIMILIIMIISTTIIMIIPSTCSSNTANETLPQVTRGPAKKGRQKGAIRKTYKDT